MTVVINVIIELYLCECIRFENRAIFVMSFSHSDVFIFIILMGLQKFCQNF